MPPAYIRFKGIVGTADSEQQECNAAWYKKNGSKIVCGLRKETDDPDEKKTKRRWSLPKQERDTVE